VQTEDELHKAGAIIRTTVHIGLPRMRDFDTLDKVKALLRDPWSPGLKRPPVAVLFEKEKLAALQDHWPGECQVSPYDVRFGSRTAEPIT
jgi:hypothetical protein